MTTLVKTTEDLVSLIFGNAAQPHPDNKINDVVSVSCRKHGKRPGDPCWELEGSVTFGSYWSVCNQRSKAAGFKAKISPEALTRKSRDKRPNPKKKS